MRICEVETGPAEIPKEEQEKIKSKSRENREEIKRRNSEEISIGKRIVRREI